MPVRSAFTRDFPQSTTPDGMFEIGILEARYVRCQSCGQKIEFGARVLLARSITGKRIYEHELCPCDAAAKQMQDADDLSYQQSTLRDAPASHS